MHRLVEGVLEFLMSLVASVYTWAVLLIVAGLLAVFKKSFSLIALSYLFVALLVIYPLFYMIRNGPEPYTALKRWIEFSSLSISLAIVALVVVIFVDANNFVMNFLTLPLDPISGFMFSVEVFYRDILGRTVSGLLFDFGRFYIEFIWLYLLSSVVAYLINKTGFKW